MKCLYLSLIKLNIYIYNIFFFEYLDINLLLNK